MESDMTKEQAIDYFCRRVHLTRAELRRKYRRTDKVADEAIAWRDMINKAMEASGNLNKS